MNVVRLRPRVVAADDEPDAVRLVELCLTRAGMSVRTAPDGRRALELIRAEVPDACVLDVARPHLGGLDVVRELRAREATAALPVILLTAAARPADEQSGRAAGADVYMTKPFRPGELVECVRRVIAARA